MARAIYFRVLVICFFLLATTPAIRAEGPASPPAVTAGTEINVRLKDKLRSDGAKVGDQFRGRLETPILADGRVVYPKGTEVSGYVVRAHASAHSADPGVLELDLISIGGGTKVSPVTAQTLVLKGELHKKGSPTMTPVSAVSAKGKKDSLVESDAVLTWVAVQPGSRQDWTKNPPKDARRGAGAPFRIVRQDPPEEIPVYAFSDHDRRALRSCLSQSRGLSARNPLSPATENKLRKDGTLPATLQKRVQPLPVACSQQLSPVPRKWARVVLSGRVMLLDPGARIVDVFVF